MRPERRAILAGLVVAAMVGVGLAVRPAAVVDRSRTLLFSPWFPLLLVGLYLVRPALAWPISALSVLVGYRYGIWLGLPVALVGAVGTSLIPYAVARSIRPESGWLGRFTDGSERYFGGTGNVRGVVAARLAPTPPEAISAASGVAGVPVTAFAVGTLLGELPWTVAAVLAGHSMRRLAVNAAAPDPWLVVAGIVAAAIVLVGPAIRYARRRREAVE